MINKAIEKARNRAELTITEITRGMDIPLRTWQDWEYGKRTPPKDIFKRVEAYSRELNKSVKQVIKNIDRRIAADFPKGFMSAPGGDE